MGSRCQRGRKPEPSGRALTANARSAQFIVRGDMAVLFIRRAAGMLRARRTPTAASETTYAEFQFVNDPALSSDFLDTLQRETFDYFVHEANPVNGLIADKTQAGSPASIAAVGFALSSYPVGVERGFIRRSDAIARTLVTLRFFQASVQSADPDATGYKGFYYHFLDMVSGRRVWTCELSTIDSAILLAGMLTAAAYFSGEDEDEREICALADALYLRADWNWAQNSGVTVTHGWKPESGFLRYRWEGYCEAMILYLLGLGSPTHPLPRESWAGWASTYDWRMIYDRGLLYAGPLFIHQFSHIWIDFRGIQDDYMRDKQIDYFENSRRATYVHQQYAITNPARFEAYSENSWGITASDGPGWSTHVIKGKRGASSAMKLGARLTALTMVASLPGRSLPLSLLRLRSCSRR